MKTTLRKVATPVLRPLWSRVWHRIQFRVNGLIEPRLQSIEAQVAANLSRISHLEMSAEKAREHLLDSLRGVSNTVLKTQQAVETLKKQQEVGAFQGSHTAIEDLQAAQRNLEHRVEFVRREILYEFKYGWDARTTGQFDDNASSESAKEVPWKIKNHSKVADFAKELKLNLGCGLRPLADHINIDVRDLPDVDVVAAVDNLPFEENTVHLISSSHLIEHFPQERLVRRLLPYWKSLLCPGGAFHAIVPDCAAMIAHASSGELTFEEFREVIFGSQDYAGDYHYNALTPDSFSNLLREAGFEKIEIAAEGRRNGLCYEFEIKCFKPN